MRLSLTLQGSGSAMPAAHEFAARVAERHGSTWLAIDKRADATEHLYGVGLLDERYREVRALWKLSGGGLPLAQRVAVVRGWRQWERTSDDTRLRRELRNVVGYALKPWPPGTGVRDLSRDVLASGAIAPAWATHLNKLAAGGGERAPRGGTPGSQVTACAQCGASLAGMRADALTCSGRCQVARHRAVRSAAGGPMRST